MSIIKVDIHVPDAEHNAVLYTSIQVWRSPDQDGSPTAYVDISDDSSTQAVLDGTVAGPWNLNGLTLTISVDGGSHSITFEGTDPLILSDVISAINDVVPDLASEAGQDTDRLRLTSPNPGTASSILVSASSAATALGLSTTKVNGKGARPLLAQTTDDYRFVDYDGFDNYWYKTRLYNSGTGAVSSFDTPRLGATPEVLPSSALLHCFVYLADGSGTPIANRRIFLVPTGQVQVTNDASQVYGVLSSVDRIVMTTDVAGYAEVNLVRGQTFKMFIEGTPFQREITIPSTGTDLNLLTAASTADDPFTIVTTPPILIRMS